MHPALLSDRTLVIRQACNFVQDDFFIFNTNGQKVASFLETGAWWKKLLGVMRTFTLFSLDGEGNPDQELFSITDPRNFLGDTYEVRDANQHVIGSVKTKLFSIKTRLTVSIEGLDDVEVDGGFLGRSYSMTSNGREVASIDRKWGGLSKEMFGKQTYALHLDPNLPEHVRFAIIGTVLIVDLVKEKASSSTNDFLG